MNYKPTESQSKPDSRPKNWVNKTNIGNANL